MGAFNTLTVDLKCENCQQIYRGRIQFKFGDKWQHEYVIGDKLKWGGNDDSIPNLPNVKVYGILENEVCLSCNYTNPENFYIYLANDVIKENCLMANKLDHYLNDKSYTIL